jgi:SHAQKYF class myb-like DNA-binding protein
MTTKPKAPRGGANLTIFGPEGNTGRWTDDEQGAFLKALKLYKNDWKKIATMLPSRTLMQIRTHAQKYFKKQAKAEQQRMLNSGGAYQPDSGNE